MLLKCVRCGSNAVEKTGNGNELECMHCGATGFRAGSTQAPQTEPEQPSEINLEEGGRRARTPQYEDR